MTTEAFRELSKNAALKTMTAFSKLINSAVGVDIDIAEIFNLHDLASYLPPLDRVVVGKTKLYKSVSGWAIFIYPEHSAFVLADTLFKRRPGSTTSLGGLEKSACREVTNILVGNFLGAFAPAFELNQSLHGQPSIEVGEFNAVIQECINEVGPSMLESFLLEVKIAFNHEKITGIGIFLFEEKNLRGKISNM